MLLLLFTYSTTVDSLLFSACSPNPCKNGGTCADPNDDGIPECTCVGGFSGDICDTPTGKNHMKNENRTMDKIKLKIITIVFLLHPYACCFIVELYFFQVYADEL